MDSFEIISCNKQNCFLEDGCQLNARGHPTIFKEIMENFDFYESEKHLKIRKVSRCFLKSQS
ncbi:hypothetical protein SAMN04515674_1075 [Pseudarcicella hirudinis]|uniref:Uncharacterized protein n=1 Tax=Pseudarcicella hirudinis TaxID=1079859 RepID=A0A1I5U5L8_9BACT|nr:hypothetical protein SAMN04515674_1075 [Pseudarcicella hirudinis]